MKKAQFNQGLLEYLKKSSDPFHAVHTTAEALRASGFTELDGAHSWKLERGGRYFTTRNESALIAFTVGKQDLVDAGIRMAGAHTDSPCLKVKPQPEIFRAGYLQLGVEVYGGVLFNPWFDRDLSLSGRVDYLDGKGGLNSCLINLEKPIAVIPSLAIHLDREANINRSVNAQMELVPLLLGVKPGDRFSFADFLLDTVRERAGHEDAAKILSHELCFYDTQAPAFVGLQEQFIASARLDNLLSCYVCLQSLLHAAEEDCGFNLVVFNDHEEVGNTSTSGADGPLLKSVLNRLLAQCGGAQDAEAFERMIRRSMFLSIDNAHGLHPNYMEKHDGNHGPLLNHGPVLKINANQRYATNSHSGAFFRALCELENVSVQSFVTRSDMGCGSTIGPVTAASLGVDTIDLGVPTFAMHSIRELAGADDGFDLHKVVSRYFRQRDLHSH